MPFSFWRSRRFPHYIEPAITGPSRRENPGVGELATQKLCHESQLRADCQRLGGLTPTDEVFSYHAMPIG